MGYIIAIIVTAVVAAINLNIESNKYGLSDLSLANVSVLTEMEYDDYDMRYCFKDVEHGGNLKFKWCDSGCSWYIYAQPTSDYICR